MTEDAKQNKKKNRKKKRTNKLFGIIPMPKGLAVNIDLDEENSLKFEIGKKNS